LIKEYCALGIPYFGIKRVGLDILAVIERRK
jgi:uncharacterized protein YutD